MKTLSSVVFAALLYCLEMLSDLYKKAPWQRPGALPAALDLFASGGGSDGASALAGFRSCTTVFHNKSPAANKDLSYFTTLTPAFLFFFFSTAPPPLSHFQL